MPYATASTEVHAGGRNFDSFPCWVEYADKNGLNPTEGEILDFPTRGEKRSFVPLIQAFYVEAEFLESSMPPFLAAFKDPTEAERFAAEQQSQVITFDQALKIARDWFKKHGYRGHQGKPMNMEGMEGRSMDHGETEPDPTARNE